MQGAYMPEAYWIEDFKYVCLILSAPTNLFLSFHSFFYPLPVYKS